MCIWRWLLVILMWKWLTVVGKWRKMMIFKMLHYNIICGYIDTQYRIVPINYLLYYDCEWCVNTYLIHNELDNSITMTFVAYLQYLFKVSFFFASIFFFLNSHNSIYKREITLAFGIKIFINEEHKHSLVCRSTCPSVFSWAPTIVFTADIFLSIVWYFWSFANAQFSFYGLSSCFSSRFQPTWLNKMCGVYREASICIVFCYLISCAPCALHRWLE